MAALSFCCSLDPLSLWCRATVCLPPVCRPRHVCAAAVSWKCLPGKCNQSCVSVLMMSPKSTSLPRRATQRCSQTVCSLKPTLRKTLGQANCFRVLACNEMTLMFLLMIVEPPTLFDASRQQGTNCPAMTAAIGLCCRDALVCVRGRECEAAMQDPRQCNVPPCSSRPAARGPGPRRRRTNCGATPASCRRCRRLAPRACNLPRN